MGERTARTIKSSSSLLANGKTKVALNFFIRSNVLASLTLSWLWVLHTLRDHIFGIPMKDIGPMVIILLRAYIYLGQGKRDINRIEVTVTYMRPPKLLASL